MVILFAFVEIVMDESASDDLKELRVNASLSVVHYTYVDGNGNDEMLRKTIQSYDLKQFWYLVDGLIVEYDDRICGASLGATGHHENRMITLKWLGDLSKTKFLGVELATTRTSKVCIAGIFDTVIIDGTVVS